ncbi:LysR family transcriptional regulator [Pinisolibacter sp.]|uniref:LysR family transcriptional regulator n=1 Tax=Pinisolibacter sp. TaxID=2172024 RepID=UPI002FDEBD91
MADLDIDLLRTFVALAETESFTAAGARLGATQSAISVRLKKLEDRLGRRLFDRTPRSVMPTHFGEGFLTEARRLLAVHDDVFARATAAAPTRRLSLGVSEHATGGHLPRVMRALRDLMPGLSVSVTLGLSEDLVADWEAGRHDAVVVRHIGRPGVPKITGRRLFSDDLVWAAAPDLLRRPGEPIPLAVIARPCRIHELAIDSMEKAGLPWVMAFVSRDLLAIQAAVEAGLGIGCVGRSAVPPGAIVLGTEDGFPALPESEIVFHADARDRTLAPALDRIADAFRAVPAPPLPRRRAS